MFILVAQVAAAHGAIGEADHPHLVRVIEVAPVDDNGARHQALHAVQVNLLEFVPLRAHKQRVDAGCQFIGVCSQREAGQRARCVGHGHGVIARDNRALVLEHTRNFERGRLANVVGVWFKGQPQDAYLLAVQATFERFAQVEDGPAAHVAVDLHDGAQQRRVRAVHERHVLERLHILGEAGAAIAQPRIEELIANAPVKAHALRHLLHIGAQLLANQRNLVDEADLRREKGVAGILDHFGGAQVGHHNARAQGQMQLRHLLGGVMVAAANHHAVGVEEIVNRRTFTRELGAGDHCELNRLGLAVLDDVGHPVARAHGHCALVDDDEGAVHGLGHAFGGHAHILEVSLAIDTAGRAHADEDEVGVGQCLVIGSGEAQPARTHVALDHLAQAGLINRHLPVAQHRDLLFADVNAGDGVAHVGKAGAGRKAHIACAGDGDILHRHFSLNEVRCRTN